MKLICFRVLQRKVERKHFEKRKLEIEFGYDLALVEGIIK